MQQKPPLEASLPEWWLQRVSIIERRGSGLRWEAFVRDLSDARLFDSRPKQAERWYERKAKSLDALQRRLALMADTFEAAILQSAAYTASKRHRLTAIFRRSIAQLDRALSQRASACRVVAKAYRRRTPTKRIEWGPKTSIVVRSIVAFAQKRLEDPNDFRRTPIKEESREYAALLCMAAGLLHMPSDAPINLSKFSGQLRSRLVRKQDVMKRRVPKTATDLAFEQMTFDSFVARADGNVPDEESKAALATLFGAQVSKT